MANLIHGAAIDQLYKCTEYLESTVRYQDSRIEKLEQLCKDFWNTLRFEMDSKWIEINRPRMEQLGLIHETEYDPDTGLKWGEQ